MIRPISWTPGGSLTVWHDERGHGGDVPPASLVFARHPSGAVNLQCLRIPCPAPGCDSESLHPVTGDGSCRAMVQRVFGRRVMAQAAGRTWLQARTMVRVLIGQQDGSQERFLLDDVATEDD